jgi:hypothetical protein
MLVTVAARFGTCTVLCLLKPHVVIASPSRVVDLYTYILLFLCYCVTVLMETLKLVDPPYQKPCEISINSFPKTEQDRQCTYV